MVVITAGYDFGYNRLLLLLLLYLDSIWETPV